MDHRYRQESDGRTRQQWRSDSDVVPSVLLEIPEEDLATVVACLTLGVLYALKYDLLPFRTGEVLAWPRMNQPLVGKVPLGLIDVVASMDEIHVLDNYRTHELTARLIDDVQSMLRDMSPTHFDIGWYGLKRDENQTSESPTSIDQTGADDANSDSPE